MENEPTRPAPLVQSGLIVTGPEDGMRLKTFLERRLDPAPPASVLHRWIRTGQVRVNKGRTQPFARLCEGDVVRVPPFASEKAGEQAGATGHTSATPLPPGLLVADEADYLVLAKPAGLAVQPGTGLSDSLADMLKAAYADEVYPPAPAHRLDRHVSGLLLAGKTRAAQERLSHWFAQPGAIKKEYLAWVAGTWPHQGSVTLEHWLKKETRPDGREITTIVPPGTPGAVQARCEAVCVKERSGPVLAGLPFYRAALIKVALLTGRTHQIRVQLAAQGTPIIGDGRHNGPKFEGLLLHAFSLTLPDGKSYQLSPHWPPPFSVASI